MTLMDESPVLTSLTESPFALQLSELAAQEAWIEQVARDISASRGIVLAMALDGARVALMWQAEYERIKDDIPTKRWSHEFHAALVCRGGDTKAAIEASLATTLTAASFVSSTGIHPQTLLAARLAFCETFPNPEAIWTLMMTEEA